MAKLDDTVKTIECACHSCWHHLHLIDWEDGTYTMEICNLCGASIWERIKLAIRVLLGKESETTSVDLFYDGLEELRGWIDRVLKKGDQRK